MQTHKMSLANIKGKLSRTEMKNIMAGTAGTACSATACCNGGGSITCSGVDQCQSIEGNTISTVTCKNTDGTFSSQSCN